MNIFHWHCLILDVWIFSHLHTYSCQETQRIEKTSGKSPLISVSAHRGELKCSQCTRLCIWINWSRHDLRGQFPAQHVLEAQQLLCRVVCPVDRVEDVHLLRHLPQLGHGVAPQRVDVGVDLGTERGQQVIAVHHLGTAPRLLRHGIILQGPGLDAGEGDGPQGQVAEYYHSEPQGADHTHGALSAHILALVSPPRALVPALAPASCLQLGLVTSAAGLGHQVLGGEDRGRQRGVHHEPGLRVVTPPDVPRLWAEACLRPPPVPVLHLPLGQTLLTRAVKSRLRGRQLGAVGQVTAGVRALHHGGRGRGVAGGRGGVGHLEAAVPGPRASVTPRTRCDGHEGRGRRILQREVYSVCLNIL